MRNEPPDEQPATPLEQLEQQQEQPVVQIDLTPEFQQNLRDLAKRYRSIRADIQAVIREIQIRNYIGDCLIGIGKGCVVFKARVRNRDIQKGKSAGYRLIYQVESPTNILLLTIYSKSDQDDINPNEVRSILNEFYEND